MQIPDEAKRAAARPTVGARHGGIVAARALQRWHRTLGAVAALFLVFLAVTGLLLVHSDRLGLPAMHVDQRWLLDWYGIRPPPPASAFQSDGHWFSQQGDHVYFDTAELSHVNGTLLGVFASAPAPGVSEWQVVTDAEVLVVGAEGEILERIGRAAGLPAGLTAVGRDAGGAVILASGSGRVRFDAELGEFAPADANGAVHWSAAGRPPAAIAAVLAQSYRGAGLSLERVLLDLHSGRLFGAAGVLVVNLASLLLVFLAASGLWLWSRRGTRSRRS